MDGIIKVKLSNNNNTLYVEHLFYRHPMTVLYSDWNKHEVLENLNWQEADQLAMYTAQLRSWPRGDREQIQ